MDLRVVGVNQRLNEVVPVVFMLRNVVTRSKDDSLVISFGFPVDLG